MPIPDSQIIDGISPRDAIPAPWVADAACVDADPAVFFLGHGQPATEAKAICAGCPVRGACLDYALEGHERYGVWGGLSERERRAEARRRRQAA
jgi:WhiB family redox-sensing transcriptional regulator